MGGPYRKPKLPKPYTAVGERHPRPSPKTSGATQWPTLAESWRLRVGQYHRKATCFVDYQSTPNSAGLNSLRAQLREMAQIFQCTEPGAVRCRANLKPDEARSATCRSRSISSLP
jgi:hypothetical protein